MKLSKRLIAGVGAPVLLAGVMLAGSAGMHTSVIGGKLSDSITFSATVITGGSSFTVNSDFCHLTEDHRKVKRPNQTNCRVSGAGTLDNEGQPSSADLTITGANGSSDGVIVLHLTNSGNCATGSATEIENAVTTMGTAELVLSSVTPTPPNMLAVTGFIAVYDPGVNQVGSGCNAG